MWHANIVKGHDMPHQHYVNGFIQVIQLNVNLKLWYLIEIFYNSLKDW